MKLQIRNGEKVLDAVRLVAEELEIELTEQDPELTVTVTETEEDKVTVCRKGAAAEIACRPEKTRFLRGLALLMKAVRDGKNTYLKTETPLFKTDGAMLDCSRNAVMKVSWIKFFLRKMALMGMNSLMLYTEDTYEVPERPYFGYMRGRYTKEELKEVDAYAASLGIELIPCIQMLGHLTTYLRWGITAPYKDTESALLVGAEETYDFLEDLIKNIAECFTSRRLHIGMDETHNLGTGKSLDQNGYTPRTDLYFEHLRRVTELVCSYGFKPMIWSDMFFRLAGKDIPNYNDYDVRVTMTPEIASLVPERVQSVFWDYYHPDEDFYRINLEKHDLFPGETVFAGGIWAWSGFSVLTSRYVRNSVPALEACRKHGTREVFATLWHNGSEANLIMTLAGLALYADYDYCGGLSWESVKDTFAAACGEDWDEFAALEKVEYPCIGTEEGNASRVLLYNDPLLGMVDANLPEGVGDYYRNLTGTLPVRPEGTPFAPAFEEIRLLSSLLENKADFGIRLKKAYDEKDGEALEQLQTECDLLIRKLALFRQAHRKAWMQYNKAQGFEVHDIRNGGLMARLETVRERLREFRAGEIDRIEELEEKRLRYDCLPEGAPTFGGGFLWYSYTGVATAGVLR